MNFEDIDCDNEENAIYLAELQPGPLYIWQMLLDLVASIILRGIGLECRRSSNQFNNVL